jgi:hypothetical protein
MVRRGLSGCGVAWPGAAWCGQARWGKASAGVQSNRLSGSRLRTLSLKKEESPAGGKFIPAGEQHPSASPFGLAEATGFGLFLAFFAVGLCGRGGVVRKWRTTFWNSGSFVGSSLLAMTVPFCSAKLRISRAEEHLQTLNAEIDKFFAKNPGRYVSEPDSNRTQEIHKICFDERLPIEWRILATEIIEHLRASLDHATVATFFLKTGRLDSNYISFPFCKTADDLDNSIRGRSKDLVPEIKTFLRGFNAYKGGNDLLYSLNKLCNSSKHTLITFVVGAALELEMKSSGDLQQVNFVEECFWDSSKNEIIYGRNISPIWGRSMSTLPPKLESLFGGCCTNVWAA